ncbi:MULTISPECIES: 2-amino-4-hydroxy-6-hydroxymethyldihydropteridine diphosphokinase [unclassified Colwellia]|jgi:2-amino-4-hydroxy-6-hydroxymethyldihydropteridine diphosphokinase|uniref:2-amino-4-hydroxy-6- hydroxymethyldihydropteridine diphosphokinase n=1 Tax=unclassified Colwellia TaxID=196834 RepID=UPI0015F3C2A0|nr:MULTISPECIES: 2-amino-4-hydroxy-6-hydroxymethyldihydropteridine diphosphokinase [unclassified Colwellia]MBA6364068.1 2-amino-4-hydroxy-6-hydroxymethyldihydropteridine diphosphokinase [Colwellia sp. BRX8-8]MBA6336697.1 2-amino-4-hydroxy-6-hydroxymethyldihydropteridine diphosphokinase [Colwellia sp. BRX8-7]MBA6369868.1 2-amino-4-hydroxy-6-hydroxymethyldihydropteridine diphosphokinase [Colwellia sp. BRX8-4]MBA6378772.1 2-amino-4-hydroxy-6-hydroxymethyldihydropteridine diphosphokinase [Colwellia
MALVYVGLGSNLSDPQKQIELAVASLTQIKNTTLDGVSSLYFSRPMGPQDQPDYMNAVALLRTDLNPLDLLNELQAIENNAGRVRKDNRWGARILDLDMLLFDNETINHERLTVPHYGLELREFVLLPLAELSPKLTLPNGKPVLALSQAIATNGLKIHSKLR